MKSFYMIFAFGVFGLFCLLEYRGTSWDTNHKKASPQYYSYRGGGGSSSAVYYGSSRSTSSSSYSHK